MANRSASRRVCFILSILIFGVAGLHATISDAQSLTSQITYPAAGATAADMQQPIQWTPVANAQAYELWVGSALGGDDLLRTTEVPQTSSAWTSVPDSRLVYARIWAKVGGAWRYTDSSFTGARMKTELTYPENGAASIDLARPFAWLAVPNAQAYELYLGTAAGAKDILDSWQTQSTSTRVASLPSGRTVYARIWTEVGNVWRFTDSTFTNGSPLSAIVTPVNGAKDVDRLQPIQWQSAAGTQAQVLWLGSAVGGRDLASSLEGTQTSFVAPNLPPGRVIYARLWTKMGDIWRFTDSSFTVAIGTPTMIFPADGATSVDSNRTFSWTSVTNAQAYFLWVGTTVDAHDVVSSGDLTQTSYAVGALPLGKSTLYISIWSRVGGAWSGQRSTFQPRATTAATFLNPLDGQTSVDLAKAVLWTSTAADGYQLLLGSQPGAEDLLKTVELHQGWLLANQLAAGGKIYARLKTRIGTAWWYQDISFDAMPYAPKFVYPQQGSIGVNPGRSVEWAASQGADAYRLWIGTTPGASDLVSADALTTTSYAVNSLPQNKVLYGRVFSRVAGHFSRYSDIAFSLAASDMQASIVYPPDGSTAADGGQPFAWSDNNLAQSYRLRVGSTLGSADLHDSGEIRINKRFVSDLPLGFPLFGRLSTKLGGIWYDSDFTFTLATNTTTAATRITAGLWATALVRGMTPAMTNRPFGWTPLWESIDALKYEASCGSYTLVLRHVLDDMNIGLSVRSTQVRFSQLDVHIFVEVLNSDTGKWLVLDPTFGLAATRTADGEWASAADIAVSAVAQDWSAITYKFLTPLNDAIVRGYYLDYPLLFINDFVPGSPWHSSLPDLTEVALPVSGAYSIYIVGCEQGSQADVMVGPNLVTMPCASDGLSLAFLASSAAAPDGASAPFHLYQPRRFVF